MKRHSAPNRSTRVADQIQRDLAELIPREVRDARVALVTVTGVGLDESAVLDIARNLRAALNGQSEQALQIYTPQSRALALISTGERHAIASWGPLAFHGNWVWRWKDSIDRAFMGRYRD